MSRCLFHICCIFSVLLCVAAFRLLLIQIDDTNLTGTLLADYKRARRRTGWGGRGLTLFLVNALPPPSKSAGAAMPRNQPGCAQTRGGPDHSAEYLFRPPQFRQRGTPAI